MIQQDFQGYPYQSYPMMPGMNIQPGPYATQGTEAQSQYLVPGMTPTITSIGGFGAPSAGVPRPPVFGTDLPPAQAAQMFGQPQQPTGESPFEPAPGSPRPQGIEYVQGYLRTQIGQVVKLEFVIGTGMFMDRIGTLLQVGVDHIIIREQESDDLLLCDLFSLKFATTYK